ncbi:hypothetical protein [Phaffia rhodozyma]|uniref:Uncharacterized protein n=1 Tax=Phaffia rhodozyma TaxID=264483 RepID=A0A0F7SRH2_PHARH|nr:hypothetical protein [Phaffia rhodozyma]
MSTVSCSTSGSDQEQTDRKLQDFLLAKIPARFHPLLLRPPGPVNPAKGTSWDPSLVSLIDANEDHVPVCALPALHLLNSDWDAPHMILQDHEKEEQGIFDYLHTILHRSEGGSLSQEPEGEADGFWNATQWVPLLSHPFLLEAYPDSGGDLSKAKEGAKQFILDCEHAGRSGSEQERKTVDERNWREIKGLLKWAMVHGKTD